MEIASDDDNDALSVHSSSAVCPLFMEGLPRDFSTNPALAALASLLDDGNTCADNNTDTATKSSSRRQKKEEKIAMKRHHQSRKFRSKSKIKNMKHASTSESMGQDNRSNGNSSSNSSSASIGEASLFLQMWKL